MVIRRGRPAGVRAQESALARIIVRRTPIGWGLYQAGTLREVNPALARLLRSSPRTWTRVPATVDGDGARAPLRDLVVEHARHFVAQGGRREDGLRLAGGLRTLQLSFERVSSPDHPDTVLVGLRDVSE